MDRQQLLILVVCNRWCVAGKQNNNLHQPGRQSVKLDTMDAGDGSEPRIMWTPDKNKLTKSTKLRNHINSKYGVKLGKATFGTN